MNKGRRYHYRIRLSELFALICTALFLMGILMLKATYRYQVPEQDHEIATLPPENAPKNTTAKPLVDENARSVTGEGSASDSDAPQE